MKRKLKLFFAVCFVVGVAWFVGQGCFNQAKGQYEKKSAGGTSDSLGVDTNGDGTVDNYLYSTTAGAFHIKKGSNTTLTVAGDTVTIAGAAGAGTADSLGIDTDGDGTIDNYLYSTVGAIAMIKEGTGITLTVSADTVTIEATLGTSIEYGEITATASVNWAGLVSDETGTGVWVFGTSPTFTTDIETPLVIGGEATTSDLSLKTTSGVGETGADMHFLVGNNGATEAMTILNDGKVGIGINAPTEKLHITENNVALKFEDDSGNWGKISIGNSQFCIAIDPDDLVASSDICFDIDGDEVGRFHQNSNFVIGGGILIPPEKLTVPGNIATGDTAAGDVDVFHYFSTDGSWTTEYLKWDDGNARFEFSDDIYLSGTVLSSDTLTKSFVIASPDDTFDFPFWQTKRAITIVAVSAVCTGGTNVIGALQEYNATGTAVDAAVDADWTILTTEYTDASFTNPGIDAGDWLGWKTTSVSGSVTFFSITFEYTEQ